MHLKVDAWTICVCVCTVYILFVMVIYMIWIIFVCVLFVYLFRTLRVLGFLLSFSWSLACFLSFFLESYFFLGGNRVFFLFFLKSFFYYKFPPQNSLREKRAFDCYAIAIVFHKVVYENLRIFQAANKVEQ